MFITKPIKGKLKMKENFTNLLTVKELADVLNVPVSSIYKKTRLGNNAIPHLRIGKYIRFVLADVLSFFGEEKNFGCN